jgi:thioredoxin 1
VATIFARKHKDLFDKTGVIEMGQHTIEFSDSNFEEEVLNATDGVLVDFWAPWCGPCRQIAPLIDQLAEQFSGSVKIGKLNIDENPSVTGQYGIQSIPTLLLFKGGEVVERFVGMPPKAKLEQALTQV